MPSRARTTLHGWGGGVWGRARAALRRPAQRMKGLRNPSHSESFRGTPSHSEGPGGRMARFPAQDCGVTTTRAGPRPGSEPSAVRPLWAAGSEGRHRLTEALHPGLNGTVQSLHAADLAALIRRRARRGGCGSFRVRSRRRRPQL